MTHPAEAGYRVARRSIAGQYPARPRARRSALQVHFGALSGYAIIAWVFIDHGESLLHRIAGQGSDPFAFVWFLAWWPWALTHHLNPLFTHLVWQPEGVYLGWVTSVPLLAILGWPLTLISPVLTFNVFVLCAPVFSAWMGYFLCLRIAAQPAAAMIGGFLFGFSSYEMAQDSATLNLSTTLFVPLLLLIVLARLDGSLTRPRLVLFGGLALICQFLVCIEIFGMIFLFGCIAWVLAMTYFPQRRAVLRRLVSDGLWTSPFVILALSPWLVSMALHAGTIRLPALWPYYFVADPLNFLIPSRTNLLGGLLHVSARFNGGVQEQDSYLGLPLLLIIVMFAWEKYRLPAARFLLLMLLLLVVASLGPRLWMAGVVYQVALPWGMFVHLPLIGSALPTRFALFVSLLTAIIATIWTAAAVTARQRITRYGLALLAGVFLLPQFHPWRPLPELKFFQPGRVEAVLGSNARVLVLPFAIQGPSSFWQAQSHFGFVQTGGYLGFPPRRMQDYPAVFELFSGIARENLPAGIDDFCTATHTQFIVIGPGAAAPVQAAVAQLNWPARKIDDVVVYTVPAHG
jgi:hypothetical protein